MTFREDLTHIGVIGDQVNGSEYEKIIIVIDLFLLFINLRFSPMTECQLLQNTRPQTIFQKYFTHIGISVAKLGDFNMKKIV